MPVKMIGLAELETDMAEIINRALTDCQTLTDDIRTVIQKEIERKTNSHSYSDSQMITVPDDSMLPRLEALAILEAEKFSSHKIKLASSTWYSHMFIRDIFRHIF